MTRAVPGGVRGATAGPARRPPGPRRPGAPPLLRAGVRLARRLWGLRIKRDFGYDARLYHAIGWLRDWRDGDVVFDVGANDGRTALRLLRHLPARPRICAFEPVMATFQLLQREVAGLDGVCAHRLALGARPGEAEMRVDGVSANNSILDRQGAGAGREIVPVSTVDREASARGLSRLHLLKVDAEGYDLEVLKGARGLLEDGAISLVQVEVGLRREPGGSPMLEEVRDFLEPFGYPLAGLHNLSEGRRAVRGSGGREVQVLVYADALFASARDEGIRVAGRG